MRAKPALVLLLALTAAPAVAEDLYVYTGAAVELEFEPDGAGSQDKTDFNAYIEVERRGLYAGIWAEVSNQDEADQIDLYLGYRGETAGGFSYALSIQRSFLINDVGDYTEADLSLGLPLGDKLSVSFDGAWYPEFDYGDAYVGAAWALNDRLSVSANYGTYGVEDAPHEQEWDFGAGYSLNDETVVDVRYYDGTDYTSSYLGLSINWDTTLFSR